MAVLLNAKTVDEIHFMRKIVIDGSNTSGFQRTALVAIDGRLSDVGIQTIALEEDAARKLEEKGKLVNYGLDRLGIPLIEIATAADIKDFFRGNESVAAWALWQLKRKGLVFSNHNTIVFVNNIPTLGYYISNEPKIENVQIVGIFKKTKRRAYKRLNKK